MEMCKRACNITVSVPRLVLTEYWIDRWGHPFQWFPGASLADRGRGSAKMGRCPVVRRTDEKQERGNVHQGAMF
jgi:hypothetical protein